MSEGRFDGRRDGWGLGIFTAGAFFSVLVVKALSSGGSLQEAGVEGALARMWTASFGALPSLVFTAGIAILGARLFLHGGGTTLVRNAGKLALVCLGLSVLLGSFSAPGGGVLGELTGGAVSRWTHPLLGVLVGLGAFGGSIWVVWQRGGPVMRSTAVRASDRGAVPESDEGVSAAEAAALIPEALPRAPVEIRKQGISGAFASVSPSSPYPEDVRLRGEVPAGARALESRDDSDQPEGSPAAPAVYHWSAPGAGEAGHAADEDLAAALASQPGTAPEFEGVEEIAVEEIALVPRSLEETARLKAGLVEEIRLEEELDREEVDTDRMDESPGGEVEEDGEEELVAEPEGEFEPEEIDEPEEATLSGEVHELAPLPRASWEQPSLFETEEEPVDAYGTPITLVETLLRPAQPESGAEDRAESTSDAGTATTAAAAVHADEPTSAPADVRAEAQAEAQSEREVVLKPKAAPSKAHKGRSVKSPSVADSPSVAEGRAKLLAEAGCLLVERGRVAVSMLQKQYGMDFDEACKVLDELQHLGLIGPYLGGQHRDILLTREEWLEKVSSF